MLAGSSNAASKGRVQVRAHSDIYISITRIMEQNQELKITTDSAAVKLLPLLIQLPMCALCFCSIFFTCLHFLKLHLTSQGHRNGYSYTVQVN